MGWGVWVFQRAVLILIPTASRGSVIPETPELPGTAAHPQVSGEPSFPVACMMVHLNKLLAQLADAFLLFGNARCCIKKKVAF